jgi:hypothetical protein
VSGLSRTVITVRLKPVITVRLKPDTTTFDWR